MRSLKGKTVLITDAYSPSGKAIVEAFKDEGARLALNTNDSSNILEFGEYCYNINTEAGAKSLINDVINDFSVLDILIHNSNHIEPVSILESTDKQITETFTTNAKSAFFLTQAAGRYMKNQQSGSIVYISSIHAEKPSGSSFAYSMAKSAVGMLCKETVLNLGKYGIRANVIEMGPVEGDREIFKSDISRLYDNLDLKLNNQPAGTWEQAARLAVFLTDGNCPFINGQSITLDGGFLLNYGYKLNYEELIEFPEQKKKYLNKVFGPDQPSIQTGTPFTDISGRTAVITGSATGVGQGIAVLLAALGMNVVVTHNRVPADKTMKMIKDAGGKAIDVSCNVGNDESVAGLFTAAKKAFGGVDVLINNAMIQPNRWFLEYTSEEYDNVMNTNALGYIRTIRHAAPLLMLSKAGRVINISSVHAKRPGEFDPVYSMTKAAIKMLTREAAIEFAASRVTVNTLTLGAIRVAKRTGDDNFKPVRNIELREMPYGFFLSGRIGITEDAGYLCAYLASEASQFMTGSSIRIDGGINMAHF